MSVGVEGTVAVLATAVRGNFVMIIDVGGRRKNMVVIVRMIDVGGRRLDFLMVVANDVNGCTVHISDDLALLRSIMIVVQIVMLM